MYILTMLTRLIVYINGDTVDAYHHCYHPIFIA